MEHYSDCFHLEQHLSLITVYKQASDTYNSIVLDYSLISNPRSLSKELLKGIT
eukprot:UN16897